MASRGGYSTGSNANTSSGGSYDYSRASSNYGNYNTGTGGYYQQQDSSSGTQQQGYGGSTNYGTSGGTGSFGGSSGGAGGGGSGGGGGGSGSYGGYSQGANDTGFDKMQEQLNLRESQLAMASNLLEQQSRLIADVSFKSRDRPSYNDDRAGGGGGSYRRVESRERKRSGSDYRDGDRNKRRRTDSNDDWRDNRRGGNRSQGPPQRFGGGRQDNRQDNRRSGGGGSFDRGGRGDNRSRRGGGGGGGGGGRGGGGGGGGRNDRGQSGNRRQSQGGGKGKGAGGKKKTLPRVSKEESRSYCHICEVECFNEGNYKNHLSGNRHKEKSDLLEDNPMLKLEVDQKIKAQEALRNVPLPSKHVVDHCDICDLDIYVTLTDHIKFKQHRQREMQVIKGCSWCNVGGFANFSEVLAHRLTDMHKEKKEELGENLRGEYIIVKPEFQDVEKIPSHNPNKPRGTDYIVAVTGFFCKLCNKFYKKEDAAKKAHCESETHFEKWRKAKIEGAEEFKIKMAEQEEREEAAIAKIEAARKKKEEEQAAAATEAAAAAEVAEGETVAEEAKEETWVGTEEATEEMDTTGGVVETNGEEAEPVAEQGTDQWADESPEQAEAEAEPAPEDMETTEQVEPTEQEEPALEAEDEPVAEVEQSPKRQRATRGRGRGRSKKS